MIRSLILGIVLAAAPATALAQQQVTCNDGTTAKASRGACSHHGGVMVQSAEAKPKADEARPATREEARKAARSVSEQSKSIEKTIEKKVEQPANEAAIAKCKDGTLSYAKTHSGACSHHRGVSAWLKK